jgi:hypothetical protein
MRNMYSLDFAKMFNCVLGADLVRAFGLLTVQDVVLVRAYRA